jgi:hypothetical protein
VTNLFVVGSVDVFPEPANKVALLETIAEVHLLRRTNTHEEYISVFLGQTSSFCRPKCKKQGIMSNDDVVVFSDDMQITL